MAFFFDRVWRPQWQKNALAYQEKHNWQGRKRLFCATRIMPCMVPVVRLVLSLMIPQQTIESIASVEEQL
jgi:hypothetical protein